MYAFYPFSLLPTGALSWRRVSSEKPRTELRPRIQLGSREFSLRILGPVSTVEWIHAVPRYVRVAPSCQVTEHSVRTQGEVRRQLSPSPARPRLS